MILLSRVRALSNRVMFAVHHLKLRVLNAALIMLTVSREGVGYGVAMVLLWLAMRSLLGSSA